MLEQAVRAEKYNLCEVRLKMPTTIMKLYKIRLITTPTIQKGGIMPSFKVFCKFTEFYNSLDHAEPKFISNRPHSDHVPVFRDRAKEEAKEMDVDSDEDRKKKKKKNAREEE